MRAVRSKDTKPEHVVRRMAHSLGYRFRLHRQGLPGRPDLVFPSRKAAVFVHGCFWHGHICTKGQRRPTTNTAFWNAKLDGNIARDARDEAALREAGWRVMVVWECETKDTVMLEDRLRAFLG